MVLFTPSKSFFTVLLFLSHVVYATTWALPKLALADAQSLGSRAYFQSGGTIQELASPGVPSSPDSYNAFAEGFNFALSPTEITNVAALSAFGAVGYISPTTQDLVICVFYQESMGNIRSVWYNGTWQLDPTVIATVTLEASIVAFQQSNTAGQEAVVVQYSNANGVLTQRVSTTDEGNWSVAGAVTT
ncbi:hypothetical protein K439DRAFT_1622830 [Ramaria rubella]|nr:hypothetical protein K439DRAFT_1622830 [Ramaria rubella]